MKLFGGILISAGLMVGVIVSMSVHPLLSVAFAITLFGSIFYMSSYY